ncbi:clathrin adaptor complex small chain-domain-containing protein [Trametes meyenii]|nr:clathrin adaptor complex small chain-domain-containing protein [Trametes meyenii]
MSRKGNNAPTMIAPERCHRLLVHRTVQGYTALNRTVHGTIASRPPVVPLAMINYMLLVSRQGKVRLAKWYQTMSQKAKAKIVKDVTQLVLARRTRMCNFLEYKDTKVVYRRYASLFFVCGISQGDNELVTLEIIHRYVEVLDRYFGNVCELDLIFNFQKAYAILDELIIAGELQESSKKSVLRVVTQADSIEEQENSEDTMARLGSLGSRGP